MADSEETTQGSSTSSTATTRKRRSTRRRTARGSAARKRTPARRASSASRSRSLTRRKTARRGKNSLAELLDNLQKRAVDAGTRIAKLSGEGAGAAKKAVGTVSASSRKTIQGVKREWNRMDSGNKVKFVAALLGTLAAASGTVVASRRRK